jgi:FixJ family two-component response regulator
MGLGRVLIVDDDPSVRDMVRVVLVRAGYDVLSAADGQEAIKVMATGNHAASVNALLCDLEMPHMAGQELIAHFHVHYPTVPIILLSGASDFVFTEAMVQQGVSDWLRKPTTREKLLEKVRVAVRLHQLRRKDGSA